MSPEESKKEQSLRYSIRDGVFVSMMNGFTLDYFTPFLILLGGTMKHVGILSALPNLFASFVQLKSPDITDRLLSRKKVVSLCILFQAVMLPPMVLSWFLEWRVGVFIAIVTLFTVAGAVLMPAWGSLMADLVKEEQRGEYFGWRSKTLGIISVLATFAAGFILHRAEKSSAMLGFAIIFGLAFVFRLVSWRYMNKMHEPPMVKKEGDYFSLRDFVSRYRTSNFVRFVVFVSLLKFTVYIASPFFAVLMLKDLGFGYMAFTMVTLAATISAIVSIRRWGRHADRVGNLKVARSTSMLVALIPMFWLVNQNPVYLFFVQLFSGFAWAGFNLSASNFVFDASSPGKRARCIAYFNFFSGIAMSLGALAGGWLAMNLPAGFLASSAMNLILISAVLRLIMSWLLPFNLKEVREVDPVRTHELFWSMLRFKPVFVKGGEGK
ncbi:MAG: MFS transporter [Deltaproteobacteria bacterium]|nr:MFS transporter [Deltaproteobacteria bacterium]